MASRHKDWIKQAQHDLEMARTAMADSFFEWACFAAHQSAEKAVKAVIQKSGGDAWGHSVAELLQAIAGDRAEDSLIDLAKELDKHYIPARYPNAHPGGSPHEYYTGTEAQRAISGAEAILEHCHRILAEP